jgi:hypothetical protein
MFKRTQRRGPDNESNKLTKRAQFILGTTALFAIVEMLVLLPYFWPSDGFTVSDAVTIALLGLICVAGGVFCSVMIWKTIKALNWD